MKNAIDAGIFFLLLTSHIVLAAPQRCTFERVKDLIAFNCADMKLIEIPNNLKTSTEILLASENRIKKLTRKSFANYSKLKFLYLFNNMIKKIEPGSFSMLTSLETLDLSDNSLREVPADIFHLPNLRKLYLADNDLGNDGFLTILKPVTAPLEYLNIANTEIESLPDFGVLPYLSHLNLSHNHLESISPEQFASFCQITFVDLNETRVDDCECHKTNFLLKELKHDRDAPLTCGPLPQGCNLDLNSTEFQTKEFFTCMSVKEELVHIRISDISRNFSTLHIVLGVFGLLFLAMILAHCNQRPQKKQQHIELSQEEVNECDMPVNPDSRSTLIL